MSSMNLNRELQAIDPVRLAAARQAFMSVPKSLTIRRGKVDGEAQLEERLKRAVAAYQAGSYS